MSCKVLGSLKGLQSAQIWGCATSLWRLRCMCQRVWSSLSVDRKVRSWWKHIFFLCFCHNDPPVLCLLHGSDNIMNNFIIWKLIKNQLACSIILSDPPLICVEYRLDFLLILIYTSVDAKQQLHIFGGWKWSIV